eukprot:CAMPEP_0171293606 /NCGR_PEP_ID=MMETSP0816-20121228/1908_1 /TAXON_ID=420281 /ORGANISM="Proboscia inermis, Strain CCAP1064/1" /LENGTH=47 /DNA_ID= /DNA_START= /DNA_END= /DNA_ORIENTATION=
MTRSKSSTAFWTPDSFRNASGSNGAVGVMAGRAFLGYLLFSLEDGIC